jgi:hypothetical protein
MWDIDYENEKERELFEKILDARLLHQIATESSIKILKKLIKKYPSNAEPYYYLSCILFEQKHDIKNGIKMMKKAFLSENRGCRGMSDILQNFLVKHSFGYK